MNYLNNVKELVQLEFEYLSSPDKLLKLMDLYLENDLEITSVENIKIISEIDQINSTNFNINKKKNNFDKLGTKYDRNKPGGISFNRIAFIFFALALVLIIFYSKLFI